MIHTSKKSKQHTTLLESKYCSLLIKFLVVVAINFHGISNFLWMSNLLDKQMNTAWF